MNKSLLLLGLMIFIFASFTSATITVSLPVDAPTGLTATLQEGGSLEPNTTYYYVVIAYSATKTGSVHYYSPIPQVTAKRYLFHSPISEEGNFTTNTTHKSVLINWDNVPGATVYQILMTETAGDYTNSGGYGTGAETLNAAINDGTTGYEITALSTEQYIIHSIQFVNEHTGNISRELGVLLVNFSGTGTHTLPQVYAAIVSAGYGDYVRYNGREFVFKGWFISEDTASGTFYVEQHRLVFIKGGIANFNPNYVMRFGRNIDEIKGAYDSFGCTIDFQNSRYPLTAYTNGNIQIYGSYVSMGMSVPNLLTETKSNTGYSGNYVAYFSGDLSNYRDSIFANRGQNTFRSPTSTVKDLKFTQGNNYGSYPYVRVKAVSVGDTANMPYATSGSFYDSEFLSYPYALRMYSFTPAQVYITRFYDTEFVGYPDDMLQEPYVLYQNLLSTYNWQAANSLEIYYSIIAEVLDESGNPIEGVSVSMTDKNGDAVTWIENDGTIDRLVSGNQYTTNRTTNVNGTIDYYVLSYNISLNPDHTDRLTSPDTSTDTIKENSYPFTITFSKEGYADYQVVLSELSAKTNLLVTLESRNWNYSVAPYWGIRNDSTTGIFKISPTGDLAIAGKLYENTNSPPDVSLIQKKWFDNTWLDQYGNLYLNGTISEES